MQEQQEEWLTFYHLSQPANITYLAFGNLDGGYMCAYECVREKVTSQNCQFDWQPLTQSCIPPPSPPPVPLIILAQPVQILFGTFLPSAAIPGSIFAPASRAVYWGGGHGGGGYGGGIKEHLAQRLACLCV